MSIEILFPFLALGLAVAGALYFRAGAKQIDESRNHHHPAE
jgi:hypothetical protein